MRRFVFLLTLICFAAAPAQAADEALPPPQHDTSATGSSTTDAAAPDTESKPNLNKELSPGKSEGKAKVEVRSYTRKDGAEVSEYSVKGKVYMIKVQPPGGLPAYYLYDDNGDGNFQRRLPGGYKPLNPPVWVIKRF